MAWHTAEITIGIRVFNNAIPLECQENPYAEVAKKLGVDEEETVRIRVESLTNSGFCMARG